MSSDARIEITSGDGQGEAVHLDGSREHLVGSSQAATVRLKDKGVFFKHARLEPSDAGWLVAPALGSARVVVNGEPVERETGRLLRTGDVLCVGAIELRFSTEAAEPPREERVRQLEAEVATLRARLRSGSVADDLAAALAELGAAECRAQRAETALSALIAGDAASVLERARRDADARDRRATAQLTELRKRAAALEAELARATEQLEQLSLELAEGSSQGRSPKGQST